MRTDIDYRDIKYRQQGFDAYYQFTVSTNDCSPDIAVETWIADSLGWDFEKRCVMALFHGATYAGPCETLFASEFPVFKPDVLPAMIAFFETNKKRLLFSPDAKYRKMVFPKFLTSVAEAIKPYGTLGNYLNNETQHATYHKQNYLNLQQRCMTDWFHWGRMGHWCFAEALHRFVKAPIEPLDMEFGPGGHSHTTGWAFCVGRDDFVAKLDADKELSQSELTELDTTAAEYISNFQLQHPELQLAQYFTLETACCNYKRQHKGSRYGGCYIDEQHDEIRYMEHLWPEYKWLWTKYMEGRQAVIPASLLYENFNNQGTKAYMHDWTDALKDHGRIPRVEAWQNGQPQQWVPLDRLDWYGQENDLFSR